MKLAVRKLDKANQIAQGYSVITTNISIRAEAWNNGKEVPRWGVAEIQKMSPSKTGRCK